ncbi:MAG: EF-hand domain-containing protein [Hyphomicrobiaceae bacterium]|nr:EF-hand domain-containing protein [Hyphomicrobiaceae bacterium]
MRKRTMVIIAGLLVAAGGAAAIAAVGEKRGGFGHGPGMGPMFGEMGGGHGFGWHGRAAGWLKGLDANGDGAINLDEALTVHGSGFTRIDSNGDGIVDAQELEAENRLNVDYWVKVMLRQLDADSDGKISKEEFARSGRHRMASAERPDDGERGWRGRRGGRDHGMRGEGRRHGWMHERGMGWAFDRLDLNSSGLLEGSEIEAAVKERVTSRINRLVGRLDKDGDGRVTREEFDRPAKERFARRDIDNDGSITEEDLPPMMRGRGILR